MARSGLGTIRRGRSGRYQARVRVRGRQIGIGAFDTRREAAQALAAYAAERAAGVPSDRRSGRRAVEDFAEQWWQTRRGHRPSTQVRDRQALDRDILPFFGPAQLGRLERVDVQQWIDQLSTRVAPATVRRTFTVLAQLLDAAVERGLLSTSPLRG